MRVQVTKGKMIVNVGRKSGEIDFGWSYIARLELARVRIIEGELLSISIPQYLSIDIFQTQQCGYYKAVLMLNIY